MTKRTHNITHCHTDLSSGTTNIDSVSKYQQYVDRAVEEGMDAIAFTEHGNMFSWLYKKRYCEEKGLKYVHAVEMYVTKGTDEKVRDNYHTCMYARNHAGFIELNKLVSNGRCKEDGHFYYVPRITFEELTKTSDNIIISTACIGGGLRPDSKIIDDFLPWLIENKHRCFLEVQHHQAKQQVEYNKRMVDFSMQYGIPLIIGTDTHALNEKHAKGRSILQRAKGVFFDDENGWDIVWKTYEELKEEYQKQGILTESQFEYAVNSTHALTDMVEPFDVDTSYKYPVLYDDSMAVLRKKINDGLINRNIVMYPNYQVYLDRIESEMDAYIHNNAIDFLLLDEGLKTEAREIGIDPGPSRGSVSGSIIAYLIGMTDMDSIKRNLNFERFMNSARVSLADVDTDWPPSRREEVKNILYSKKNLYCSEIVTFNTVKMKGAVRDVCRALYRKETPKELKAMADREVEGYGTLFDSTSKAIREASDGDYLRISNYICANVEDNESQMRREHPDVFEYVDIINGAIVSLGIHPCGTIVSPIPLDENVGLISVGSTDKPVSMLNMNEINDLFFVKLDILGLENVELINETCKLANIPRMTPDNVPDDEKVWKSIRDNTLGIFQWNGETGTRYIKHLFDDETIRRIKEKFIELGIHFDYMDLFSVGNGAIRPGGASYRDALSEGIFYDNNHDGINRLLAPTLGYLVYQEQIIDFLVEFCGYGKGEADIVRRAVAKKKNSEKYLPEIKRRFIKYMADTENMPEVKAIGIIEVFLQVILDASEYLFSLNHSDAYSYIGYICGYLREYYPFEFLTVMLNNASGNLEKTNEVVEYAKLRGINILPPTFGKSRGVYFFDKSENSIYKGIASVKFMNDDASEALYKISQENNITSFIQLLVIAKENKLSNRHIEILTKIGYFRQFGTIKSLLKIVELFNTFTSKKQFKKDAWSERQFELIAKHSAKVTDKMAKDLNVDSLLKELIEMMPKDEHAAGQLVGYQHELTGSIDYINPNADDKEYVIIDVNTKYSPFITLYKPKTGNVQVVRVTKPYFNEKPLQLYDTVYVSSVEIKNKRKKVDGHWTVSEETDYFITYYVLDRIQK